MYRMKKRSTKFWDLEAQIEQIKHEFLAPFPTQKLNWDQHFLSPPKFVFGIEREGWKHKFWKFEAHKTKNSTK